MVSMEFLQELANQIVALGAFKAGVIEGNAVQYDARFRDLCAANSCGNYGRCWTCPPDCGEIGEMIKELSAYRYAIVYQTVSELEDSYDFEGMMEAGAAHYALIEQVRELVAARYDGEVKHLGAGGCRYCEVCAKREDEPCRYPEKALVSLEAHGINCSELAKAAGMKYINGADTVTYFAAIFLK